MKGRTTGIGAVIAALLLVGAGCGFGTSTQVNVNAEAGGADAMEKSGGQAEPGMEAKEDAMIKAEGSMQAGARASAQARMDAVRAGMARLDGALEDGAKAALWAAAKADLNAKLAAATIKLEAMAAVDETTEAWQDLKMELEALLIDLETAWATAELDLTAEGSMEAGS